MEVFIVCWEGKRMREQRKLVKNFEALPCVCIGEKVASEPTYYVEPLKLLILNANRDMHSFVNDK
jgi:hypothetical protein